MSNDLKTLRERIDVLEARVMHQDRLIEDLNATVTAQWRQIDLATRGIAALDERLRIAGEGRLPIEPPPPHY